MINYQCSLPDWLIIGAWSAADIYKALRAIAMKYSKSDKALLIRYYLDREPTAEDYEFIDVFAMNISIVYGQYIDKLDTQCICSEENVQKIDYLDGFFYARQ